MKNLLSIVFLCCTFISSVMRSSWHFSTSGFNIRLVPQDPQKLKRSLIITNFHQITSIFYMLLEDSFGVKSISKFSWGLEAYIKNVYEFCWVLTHVCWFRATGGCICDCARPSNLVPHDISAPRNPPLRQGKKSYCLHNI